MAESVETWIDKLCELFQLDADDGSFGAVRSYRIFELNEMPAAITPEMAPCAISYVQDVQVEYSTGGPTIFYWYGQTEFHLTEDVKPANHAFMMPFFRRILAKAMSDMQLGGTCSYFTVLQNTAGAVQAVTYRNAQGADDHQGIIVKWMVKQNVSGQYTVSR